MKHLRFLVIYTVAICAIFLPQGKAPMASLNGDTISSYSYPVPSSKPYQCTYKSQKADHDNISKKQAVAAALGLYFGVKHATAPEEVKEKDTVAHLCV